MLTWWLGLDSGRETAETSFKHDTTGCSLWEVAQPVETGQTWVIGWMKECDGEWSPLVEFGPEETAEEVLLRFEKALGLGVIE